jgi:hypothetical protein
MKNIGIHEPCSENWNAMAPTEQGAFCQKCATQVYDFTGKSGQEIKETLRSLIGQPVCGRITASQEAALNAEFEAYTFRSQRSFQSALVFSLIVVFGLTLFSCSNEQDRKQIKEIQAAAMKAVQHQAKESENLPVTAPAKVIEAVPEMKPGELQYKDLQTDLEAVDIRSELYLIDGEHSYGGAMVMTHVYQDFLYQEIPVIAEELDENGNPYPKTFESIAFPNPATTETTFELKVPVKNMFEIALYDMNGQLIRSVYSGEIDRGTFRHQLELTNLTPGIYLIAILSKDYKETVRISKI